MTDRELMQQALEALEVATTPLAKDRQEVLRAQAALRERLAQPEQEPVAWECLNVYWYATHGMIQVTFE